MRNPVCPSSCVTPADTSNELDVQNKWEENNNRVSSRCVSTEGNTVKNQCYQKRVLSTRRAHLSIILLYVLSDQLLCALSPQHSKRLSASCSLSYASVGLFESCIIYMPAASGSSQANDTTLYLPGSPRTNSKSPSTHEDRGLHTTNQSAARQPRKYNNRSNVVDCLKRRSTQCL